MHIVQRGNNRARIFLAEHDYRFYLEQFAELSVKNSCAVHAYVLMPNHVHLLLTPAAEDGPSLLMKHLAQRHAQFFNRFNRRTGALYEGRFHSSIVEDGNYLFNCYRYIELNPVRAGIAHHPSEYPWSSYMTNAEGAPSFFITPHRQFKQLGSCDEERRSAYRSLFGTPLNEDALKEMRGTGRAQVTIGSAKFSVQWNPPTSPASPPGSDPRV